MSRLRNRNGQSFVYATWSFSQAPAIQRILLSSAYNRPRCDLTRRNACVRSLHLSGKSAPGTIFAISVILSLYAFSSVATSGTPVPRLSFDSAICKSASSPVLRSHRILFGRASRPSLSVSSGSGVCGFSCKWDLFTPSSFLSSTYFSVKCHPLLQYLECCQ